jgi:hypothetical protein
LHPTARRQKKTLIASLIGIAKLDRTIAGEIVKEDRCLKGDPEGLEAELAKLKATIPESAQTFWQNATVVKVFSLLR